VSVDKTLEDICVRIAFSSELSVTQSHPEDFTLITIQIMPKLKEWLHVSWVTPFSCFTRIKFSYRVV